ncbi:ORF6N domain-containing protein [Polaribacter sp. SA4-12]|uniref:ORF6N domain-containing protein n=1 Tax=Polaribacter sp. SA4-12 TaxID=1312072 RepID=UPI000B3C9829|nr:ORF6N domain-containing protein [Polaribacter sp. SA4-12]ARV13889.1 DNA-binding protein [Polaribacter sp. SA4-12]
MKEEESLLIPDEIITNKIYLIRNQKVMLDSHLAELYQVETKVLKRQVRRNINRFPDDFMFEITKEEYESLRSQFGTLKRGEHSKYLPIVFTEQGVAMLSSVLNSDRAIAVNIKIIRIFSKMRELLTDNVSLRLEIEEIKKKVTNQSKNIELVFSYLDELIEKKEEKTERTKIGFKKDKG